jgi:hypothetical protein
MRSVRDQAVHPGEQRKRLGRKIILGQDRRAHRRVGQPQCQLLAVQFSLQLAECGPVRERVVPGKAEQHPEGPGRDLRIDLDPVLERLARTLQLVTPQVRRSRRLDHGERHRPFDVGRQLGHPVELAHRRFVRTLPGHALRSHLEDATAARGHRPAKAEQFLLGGVRSGHRLAVHGAVTLGA